MKVVLCSNAFKECLTSREASEAMRAGVLLARPDAECVVCPLADGGDSSLEVLCEIAGGTTETLHGVEDPLGRSISASYGVVHGGKTIIVEMAAVSGLRLLNDNEKNPLHTSTYGTGQLLAHALQEHPTADDVVICIGGSATNDMGIGMASALGYRFYSESSEITHPTGADMGRIQRITSDSLLDRVPNVRFSVACDVETLLLGREGATHTFGPQKGADTEEKLFQLEQGMKHLAGLLGEHKAVLLGDSEGVLEVVGGGAAGGMGVGCRVFLGATLKRGFEVCCEAVGLRGALAGADLAITGEGKLDSQTSRGKVPHGVAELCNELSVPLAIIAGSVDHPAPPLNAAFFSLCRRPMSLAEAMNPSEASLLLTESARNITHLYSAVQSKVHV